MTVELHCADSVFRSWESLRCVLWTLSLHYNNHLSSTPSPILKQMIQVHMFIHYTLRPILVLFIHLSTGFLRVFSLQVPSFSDCLPSEDDTFRPPQQLFDHFDNIWRRVETKLVMHCSPVSVYFHSHSLQKRRKNHLCQF